jgi:hypothetical protein
MELLRNVCSLAAGRDEGVRLASPIVSFRPKRFWTLRRPCLRSEGSSMLPRLVDDPDLWLECVADMRLVAAEITDSDGTMIALRVAKDLQWFADWVDLRKNAQPNNTPL